MRRLLTVPIPDKLKVIELYHILNNLPTDATLTLSADGLVVWV